MAAEWALSYALIFLQILAGAALFRSKAAPKLALRIFGALFFLNALVSIPMTLPRDYAIWLASDVRDPVTRVFRALDFASGYLLIAFAFARSKLTRRRELAWATIILGVVLAALSYPFFESLGVKHQWILRALPLYAGLAAASWAGARGETWERWVALGLLSRALYWGTSGLLLVGREGLGAGEINDLTNRIGLLALFVASIAAAWRLLRSDAAPTPSIAVPILLLGPFCSLIELAIYASATPESPYWFGSLVLVNLVTLGLVRPVATIAGVSPGSLTSILGRSALAAGVAAFTTLLAPFQLRSTASPFDVAIDEAASFGFGLAMGLLTLAFLDWFLERRAAAPRSRGGFLASESPPDLPHWKTLILGLQGSSLGNGIGEPRLTQKGLIERTGLRAARISTLVPELNMEAPGRLDKHVPEWRATYRGTEAPQLIRQYRGSVEGMTGVWTFYRLTREGEMLAEALSKGLDRQDPAEFTLNSPGS